MELLREVRGWEHVVGDPDTRRAIIVTVVGLLVLASSAFALGMDVGLSLGWIVVALGIALVAGAVGAGLVPTAGSLWLVGLWWFTFPPLVGYLGGGWEDASRYTHPRMLGFAYPTARAELLGGLEYGVKFGLVFAIIGGTVAYVLGIALDRLGTRLGARR